ncbi:MAG: GNAT family N-acetyltransferase [Saezia sp.]
MVNTEQFDPLSKGPVYIDVDGFVLRSLTVRDVTQELLAWFNQKELLRGLNLPELQFTYESLVQLVNSFDNMRSFLIGIFSDTGQLLGFYALNLNMVHKVCLITAGVGSDIRLSGREVVWKTIDALLDYFFDHRGVEKFTCRVLETNRRILFVMRGGTRFVLEARLYKDCVVDDERVDVLLFSAFKNPEDNRKGGKSLV